MRKIVSGEMSGTGAVISGNYAEVEGGGIDMHGAVTFTMSGANAVISGNTTLQGGGVMMNAVTSGGFAMIAGKILGNTGNEGNNLFVIGSLSRAAYWPEGTKGWLGNLGYSGAAIEERSGDAGETVFANTGVQIDQEIHAEKVSR
jgi:hypothetical protein